MKSKLLTLLGIVFISASFAQNFELDTELYVDNFSLPLGIENAGDDRLFIIEKAGTIAIIDGTGNQLAQKFLDITSLISSSGERGLLGLAFHPNYATTGFFYVHYINLSGDSVISQFSVNPSDANDALENSEIQLLTYIQPFSNHNGGDLTFGPDGMLYIASGDGGSGNDPLGSGQDLNSLLGKVLRLDVNDTDNSDMDPPYIPNDNPYLNDNDANTRSEIWAYGLRNPFRFSFDSANNDFWIADVGQNAFEEINKVSGNPAGINYGWKCYEGNSTTTAGSNSSCLNNTSPHTPPFIDYAQTSGRCSVTGGRVYRGTEFPNLVGVYIFSDYCKNELGAVESNGTVTFRDTSNSSGSFVGFGVDNNNVLYVASINGGIYKVIDTSILSQNDISTEDIAIFPNPAQHSIAFAGIKQNTDVTLHTITGQYVLNTTLKENTSIAINQLPEGFYLVTITTQDGIKHTKSLIISR